MKLSPHFTYREATKSDTAADKDIDNQIKNLQHVVNVVHNAGLARRVARMRPLGVIKG